jgi:uncharacterized protein YllA (UPF0747 family)
MNKMNKIEKIRKIESVIRHYKNLEKESKKLSVVFPEWHSSDLYEGIYSIVDTLIDEVSKSIEDNFEWLSWFIYENKCGKKGFEANGKKIRTVAQLVKVIDER